MYLGLSKDFGLHRGRCGRWALPRRGLGAPERGPWPLCHVSRVLAFLGTDEKHERRLRGACGGLASAGACPWRQPCDAGIGIRPIRLSLDALNVSGNTSGEFGNEKIGFKIATTFDFLGFFKEKAQ